MSRNQDSTEDIVTLISRSVSSVTGVQLEAKQRGMVESRLERRLFELGMSVADYQAYFLSHRDEELPRLVSLLTTHHTYFFREYSHFEFLENKFLPQLVERARARPDRRIRIWSAACSRGQEVYSLSMVLRRYLDRNAPMVSYEILGTDVDSKSVELARNGVYLFDEIKEIPQAYQEGNWARGTGEISHFAKARASIKAPCRFEQANLLQIAEAIGDQTFDVIFCKNVLIYFSQSQVREVARELLRHLASEGSLFVGISESLRGLGLSLAPLGPSIYGLTEGKRRESSIPMETEEPELSAPSAPIRVVCVDDSRTIQSLLKRVLVREHGFEVVATADNGIDAYRVIQSARPDIVTLDIQMPEMGGVEYLEKRFQSGHPPVVMISSLSRDDRELAMRAMELGASDYVEKPSAENFRERAEEIRTKLRVALQSGREKSKRKIRVLIVDDSATIRGLLSRILSSDPEIEIVGQIGDPYAVEGQIAKLRPDVITLDIQMPGMDGVTLLRSIYPRYRIPTLMVSALSPEDGDHVLNALQIGAFDYLKKPDFSEIAEISPTLIEKIKAAAQARPRSVRARSPQADSRVKNLDTSRIVAIGTSTGGPEALRELLTSLPSGIPPLLIVQHIPPVFSAALARRLDSLCPFTVKEAASGDRVEPGKVLICPGGQHMRMVRGRDGGFEVELSEDPPRNRHRPSVDVLFESIARLAPKGAVGIILTGMGSDGANGLLEMRKAGATTLAQGEKSCTVFGMPREAIRQGGAEIVKELDEMPAELIRIFSSRKVA